MRGENDETRRVDEGVFKHTLTRSPRTEQHMHPLFMRIISSLSSLMRSSLSMPASPTSFSITRILFPRSLFRMLFTSVVLPHPCGQSQPKRQREWVVHPAGRIYFEGVIESGEKGNTHAASGTAEWARFISSGDESGAWSRIQGAGGVCTAHKESRHDRDV